VANSILCLEGVLSHRTQDPSARSVGQINERELQPTGPGSPLQLSQAPYGDRIRQFLNEAPDGTPSHDFVYNGNPNIAIYVTINPAGGVVCFWVQGDITRDQAEAIEASLNEGDDPIARMLKMMTLAGFQACAKSVLGESVNPVFEHSPLSD
jgi:hypothetical protein